MPAVILWAVLVEGAAHWPQGSVHTPAHAKAQMLVCGAAQTRPIGLAIGTTCTLFAPSGQKWVII